MRPVKFMGNADKSRMVRAAAVIVILVLLFSAALFHVRYDLNYAVSGLAAPALTRLTYTQTKAGKYHATLNWKARKGRVYQVLRKKKAKGKYAVIGKVKAKKGTGTFTDKKIGKNKAYTYTVRRVILKGNKITKKGKYDKEGLTTVKLPSLTVKFTNLKADLSWKKSARSKQYKIYRKVGKSDSFHLIRTVSSSTVKYTDNFHKAAGNASLPENKRLAELMKNNLRNTFVDPSNNPVSYAVRGYYAKRVNLVKKESFGLYLPDGEFRLEAPSIVGLSDSGVLRWGATPYADGYRIYMRNSDSGTWTKITDVKARNNNYLHPTEETTYQDYKLSGSKFNKKAYYTVRAYAKKNGTTVYSSYDKGFTRKNSKYSENVLFVGNSITFGSPYYGTERGQFNYANRVAQLTGVSFLNPAIPGSTYHHDGDTSYSHIVTGIMQMKHLGDFPDKAFTVTGVREDKSKIEDYDVVVLAGGTNDYLHFQSGFKLGSEEIDWTKIADKDKTKGIKFTVNAGASQGRSKTYTNQSYDYDIATFCGAYNQMMKYIEEASVRRVQQGKKPIQVVNMSMFYSNRTTSPLYNIINRDITKNSIGLTLNDYQYKLDRLYNLWKNRWEASSAASAFYFNTRSAKVMDGNKDTSDVILNSGNCSVRTADNLHLTKYSYAQYGNSLSKFMIDRFLGKEKSANSASQAFLNIAAQHGLLSERLRYLESGEESGDMALQSADGQAEAEVDLSSLDDETIEEMKDYIRLLIKYDLLAQMLDECSDEEYERYVKLIEDNNLLNNEEEPEGQNEDVSPDAASPDDDQYEDEEDADNSGRSVSGNQSGSEQNNEDDEADGSGDEAGAESGSTGDNGGQTDGQPEDEPQDGE